MNLFYEPALAHGESSLGEDESHHALKVLRLREGDELRATDGAGTFYDCSVKGSVKGICQLIINKKIPGPEKRYHTHLAVGMIKNADRMEWLVEKATEFGVDHISFISTDHSERRKANQERLEKIAVSAMKQSLQCRLPKVDTGLTFDACISMQAAAQKFIAHLADGAGHLKNVAQPGKNYLVLIGPEGDFSPAELDRARLNEFIVAGLGPRRLRTETAALAACHVLALLNE